MSTGEFMKRYEAATCAHDLEGTLDLIADEAIYLFSDQTSHIGKSAIRRVLLSNFERIADEIYKIDDIRWVATSDSVACCVYKFSWSGVIEGRATSGVGRGTSVLHKIDGEWFVVHEHLSSGIL